MKTHGCRRKRMRGWERFVGEGGGDGWYL